MSEWYRSIGGEWRHCRDVWRNQPNNIRLSLMVDDSSFTDGTRWPACTELVAALNSCADVSNTSWRHPISCTIFNLLSWICNSGLWTWWLRHYPDKSIKSRCRIFYSACVWSDNVQWYREVCPSLLPTYSSSSLWYVCDSRLIVIQIELLEGFVSRPLIVRGVVFTMTAWTFQITLLFNPWKHPVLPSFLNRCSWDVTSDAWTVKYF